MPALPDRDAEILSHVIGGDVRAAGTQLVLGYADEVYALCSSMVRDQTLAEDVSQEVFTRAFQALPGFRGESSVRTWILRIARNRCIDHLRAQNRAPTRVEDEPDTQPGTEPSVADLIMRREDVAAGLEALSETERALVVLRFGHELGYPELADAFGLGQGAVRMRVSRAVTKMRDALAPEMGLGFGGQAPSAASPAPAGGGLRRRLSVPQGAPPAPRSIPGSVPGAPARVAGSRFGGAPPSTPPPSPFARAATAGLRAMLEQMAGALG